MIKTLASCILCAASFATPATAEIVPFIESFNGDGDTFDNPGWQAGGEGFRDGGWFVYNRGNDDPEFYDEFDRLRYREYELGSGSFVTRLEAREVDLGSIPRHSPTGSNARLDYIQRVGLGEFGGVAFSLGTYVDTAPGEWELSVSVSGQREGQSVPSGENIAVELTFDAELLQVTMTYDPDTEQSGELFHFGPIPFSGRFEETQEFFITASAYETGEMSALLDSFTILPIVGQLGDFNRDGMIDAQDVDRLSLEISSSVFDSTFDLNNDLSVDVDDRAVWVHDVKQTYFGDANLDSEFASSDLVNVFTAGEYEDAIALNSTWATGDWDGDQEFTSSDLVLAFQDGGFEQRARVASSIPEPVSPLSLSLLLGWLVAFNRRVVT